MQFVHRFIDIDATTEMPKSISYLSFKILSWDISLARTSALILNLNIKVLEIKLLEATPKLLKIPYIFTRYNESFTYKMDGFSFVIFKSVFF